MMKLSEMALKCYFFTALLLSFSIYPISYGLPDQGMWTFTINQDTAPFIGIPKSLYKDSTLSISVACTPEKDDTEIKIGWVLRQTPCYEEYLSPQLTDVFSLYYECPSTAFESSYSAVRFLKSNLSPEKCTHTIDLKPANTEFQVHETSKKCEEGANLILSQQRKLRASEKPNPDNITPVIEKLPAPQEQSKKVDPPPPNADSSVLNEQLGKDDEDNIPDKTLTKNDPSSTDKQIPTKAVTKDKNASSPTAILSPTQSSDHLAVVDQDGVFLLVIFISVAGNDEKLFNATLDIKMKGPHGYLSAVDWPLLPFYGVMCGIYVVFALVWLTVSALQWRDLLRIQFWIGGVIFLGLIEKAVFYAEYQYINSTGQSGHGGMLFAEVLSCFKRTLARLLVIIVSLGFGIVKPRLGPALHRVIGVGALYFTLCSIEGWLRVLKPKNDPSNQTLMAEIPLAVLDSGICWWIFSSLVQTTRTLRLRRNVVKLGLYRHFTNTLIFSVLASVVYMSWSLYNHKLTSCITDWKELWVDEAYWHLLFSLLLLVIMILWRPTNNNQRYAFTPLLDSVDEEEDLLEKETTAMNDIYGTKARGSKSQSTSAPKKEQKNGLQDEDLKWVEENIPSSLSDTALPSLLDSDEEIMTVRFERNKME